MFMTDTMKGATDEALCIPDHDMNPRQLFLSLMWFNRFSEMMESHIKNIIGVI